jgi:hypothetical protein
MGPVRVETRDSVPTDAADRNEAAPNDELAVFLERDLLSAAVYRRRM